jgi:hypothetical protein
MPKHQKETADFNGRGPRNPLFFALFGGVPVRHPLFAYFRPEFSE